MEQNKPPTSDQTPKQESQQESPYDVSELFVSRTDKRGVINAGNKVFVRVSNYTSEDLLGSPHNIIRHPDIPKAVFKLLWDTIKSGKEIAAYVKNRAADGRFYWVLATVYPTQEGYLSIRLKPTSPLKDTVASIYAEVLAVEKEKGMEAGFEHLVKMVRNAGFPAYDDFMQLALKTELGARDEALLVSPVTYRPLRASNVREHLLNEMWESAVNAADGLRESSGRLSDLGELKEACGDRIKALAPVCEKLESLAVNMFISAHKLGKDGSSLAIVANSFRSATSQVVSSFEQVQKCSEFVLRESGNVGIDISLARVQAEMLLFNIGEIAADLRSGRKITASEQDAMLNEFGLLLSLVQSYFLRHKKQIMEFHETLVDLRRSSENLHQLMVRLDLIRTGGKLEGSRSNEITELFRPFVADMANFVRAIDAPVGTLLRTLDTVEDAISRTISCTNRMDYVVEEMQVIWRTFREQNRRHHLVQSA